MIVVAAQRPDIEKFCKNVGYSASADAKGIVLVDDKVRAMVLYDHWTPNSVNVHVYSSGPKYLFHREFVCAIFSYPFQQCGKGLLIAITPSDAEQSLAVSRYLGFVEKYRVKDGWSQGVDLVIKEMTRDQCRWLNQEKAA